MRKRKTSASRRKTVRKRPLAPAFRSLEPDECLDLLSRNAVMRLAFSFQDQVDIEPLHYIVDGEWLYGRTSPGSKLVPIRHHHWVAFEVDEIDGPFDWKSVVGHGALYVLSGDGSPEELRARRRAIKLLRGRLPETLKPDDPVPMRTVVFRIHVDRLSGREAYTRRRR